METSSTAHKIARAPLRQNPSSYVVIYLLAEPRPLLTLRYPSFSYKAALGRLVRDNTSLRVGTRDYDTLFQSLILVNLHIVDPILVVISALESGDATEDGIESAFVGVQSAWQSVKIKYMKDSELAAKTLFFETRSNLFTFWAATTPASI
ncbi:hypothetical protein EDB85DRAFT_1392568 [Lactarius pseudohatsudake]|nr:hypothetical protein EDB85DRAFT_1392568 [Lactarius pseudohatsudake]